MKYMHVSKAAAGNAAADNAAADNAAAEACGAKSDAGRRAFIAATAVVASSSVIKAQENKVDGGLAAILDKKVPARKTPIVPPGALSLKNMAQHCTGCQLCVSVCPNGVLRPSTSLLTLMQPESSYERGYCRPECNKCSEVCPAGAIRPISVEDKSSTQIGHAVWVKENCIIVSDGVDCGNCARHCPVGAIKMVPMPTENKKSNKRLVRIPAVDESRCIGCGACENLCPSRPFSAIYVEGHQVHKTV
jgi:ferredoxin